MRFPIIYDLSPSISDDSWSIGLGLETYVKELGGKVVLAAVSGRSDLETSNFEFLYGKIRWGSCGMFCRYCSHDRFEWSFTQFGSAV